MEINGNELLDGVGSFFFFWGISVAIWMACWYFLICLIKRLDFSKYLVSVVSQGILSSLHGFVGGVAGFSIMFQCRHDILYACSPWYSRYIIIGSSYFFYDLIAMFYCYCLRLKEMEKCESWGGSIRSFLTSRPMMIMHHVVLGAVFFPVIFTVRDKGNFISGCFFIMEVSSIFVNIRFILNKTDFTNSLLYLINGLCMLVTFSVCRVFVFPFMYIYFVVQRSSMLKLTYYDTFLTIPPQCHLYCLLMLIPQVYWLAIMIKGARKLLDARNNDSIQDKQQKQKSL